MGKFIIILALASSSCTTRYMVVNRVNCKHINKYTFEITTKRGAEIWEVDKLRTIGSKCIMKGKLK